VVELRSGDPVRKVEEGRETGGNLDAPGIHLTGSVLTMTGDLHYGWYLDVLGLELEEPSIGYLNRVVSSQLIRAPFENISKLFVKRTRGETNIPSLEGYLDGIERFNFGGTCYANNLFLFRLLDHLGFDVRLCGADMNNPDVHIVSMVRFEGREYLVDVGYAAPFFEPLPRDIERDQVIEFGRCRYVLHPVDDLGRSRLDMYRDDKLTHGYLAKPESRSIDEFDAVIRDSYRSSASFMNAVVIERFSPGGSVRFHNLSMTETSFDAGATTTDFGSLDDLIEAIEDRCGVPADVIRRAIEGVNLSADIYS
jgi:arylamine N-acetyltransferase